jgi:hypothetical protein
LDPFRVHELAIAGRHYILLPKLNSAQMQVLAKRLTEKGLAVRHSGAISAKSVKGVIHVDPRGYCWSTFDPNDEVLPAIPALLEIRKERKPLMELAELYFKIAHSRGKTVVRLATRIESSTIWKALRASGDCGLSPDECAVISFLVKQARGKCRLLTDYPTDESVMRVYGRRRYFESSIGIADAGSTLRFVGHRASRNSYVPRDGTLMFDNKVSPPKEDLSHLLEGLGEWCYFQPT